MRHRKRRKKIVPQCFEYDKNISGIKAIMLLFGSHDSFSSVMMQEFMRDVGEEYKGVVKAIFYDVWSPHGMYYADKYGIRVIPTIIILDTEWIEFFRHEGFLSKEKLENILMMKGIG
jgi:hypothetical protein